MEFKPQRMVNWYDVKQLASTGIKTLISGIFGNFADKREMEAALSPGTTFHDASDKESLWIDYVSDLGDGFNSTYTIAHLLAQPALAFDGRSLSRGDILVMGGDAVYPTPEIDEYKNRLQGPYNAASPWTGKDEARRLFVLPGNHDWYDGLTNFLRLFCQNRSLGSWLTEQKRSYFALKLPNHYWLIGIDIQLDADIDKPQMDYFQKIAETAEFGKETRIILCTAEPSWVYKSWDDTTKSQARLEFFINKVLRGEDCTYFEKNKGLSIAALLTGDLHHYSRYEHTGNQPGKVQMITAGGGGAFTHPTHLLKKEMTLNSGPATLKKSFPSTAQSIGLAWRNLYFPFYSFGFALFLGFFHLFTSWFLQSAKKDGSTFMDEVSKVSLAMENLGAFFLIVARHIRHSPSVIVLNLILLSGIVLFTDTATGKKKWNYVAGFIHGVIQLVLLYLYIWMFSLINVAHFHWAVNSFEQILLFTAEMLVVGGLISAFVFGLYLLVSSLILRIHPTEAFSSLRWEGYKNFLRIHMSKQGVTIYAVGIRKSANWKNVGGNASPKFSTEDKIDYFLIDEPIEI
jgi:hypothetical protein